MYSSDSTLGRLINDVGSNTLCRLQRATEKLCTIHSKIGTLIRFAFSARGGINATKGLHSNEPSTGVLFFAWRGNVCQTSLGLPWISHLHEASSMQDFTFSDVELWFRDRSGLVEASKGAGCNTSNKYLLVYGDTAYHNHEGYSLQEVWNMCYTFVVLTVGKSSL